MAFGAPGQVGQAAASGAVPSPIPLSITVTTSRALSAWKWMRIWVAWACLATLVNDSPAPPPHRR